MMTPKYSPGPWTIADRVMCAGDGQPVPGIVLGRMKKADARLIAASPRLVTALFHLTICAEAAGWDIGENKGFLDEARAALADVLAPSEGTDR